LEDPEDGAFSIGCFAAATFAFEANSANYAFYKEKKILTFDTKYNTFREKYKYILININIYISWLTCSTTASSSEFFLLLTP